ncbi:hypothetical protein H8D04_01480 [bacterium]|nr:hypothetical protein [bacterium]
MAYWGKQSSSSGSKIKKHLPVQSEKASGKIPTTATVRQLIKSSIPNFKDNEFYELELAEVMDVILDEEDLTELSDGTKNWDTLGSISVRLLNSETDIPILSIPLTKPLDPNNYQYPLKGEYVILVNYLGTKYYIGMLNLTGNPNSNVQPGKSGHRPEEIVREDFIYEHFEINKDIRRLWPYEGDNIFQGRWGQSIRFGSNIAPDSHEDGDDKPDSPNILIRAGQLLDADNFGKSGVVQNLKNSKRKPVKEDINADGSSVWITTDQSVKLDLKYSNALSHDYMSSLHSDDQPKKGGKQITLNSDRITFNTKQGKILGFAHDGIGFSTQKSFSVDADNGMKMNSGGATSMAMVPGGISLVTPGNSRLDLGSGESGKADRIYLSSECPSFLTLDDMAHLESCKGAILHLDDCAGIKDNQGSFLRVGGKEQGVTGYVKDRDDMGQQHLVYGEALTDILDELITSILNITAIPTGAGPSGPISATPSVADFEGIRAKLCDLLMKP